MKLKHYIALAIAIVVLGAGFYFSELLFLSYSNPVSSATSTESALASFTAKTSPAPRATSATSTATIKVGEHAYIAPVTANESVMDMMRALASSGNFTFTGKDYPDMGFFVESINGVKNANGFYWILSVNGKKSQTGASQTSIKAGDYVEWRYESR